MTELNQERINDLINYYKDKGLLIVGLNDSQGVNITSTFFKKGLLEYLAAALTNEEINPEVINAFSLTMNKTEHIDYYLNNNLSLEEIKLSQIYSVVTGFSKFMTDIHLPKCLGNIGLAYKLIYEPKPGDEYIHISSHLNQAKEPILVYSSGVNDLMRAVGANPFGIKADYKNRDKKPNYNYTLEKVNNPDTLKTVIDSIERNYNTILGINPNTDIYTLGAYIPKSLQKEEMNIFKNLVIEYNEKLTELCKQYNVSFIDTEEVGKKYNNNEVYFHISTAGHNALANYILMHLYHDKIELQNKEKASVEPIISIKNKGVPGVIQDLLCDYSLTYNKASQLKDYARQRELDIAAEHEREMDVFKKVLTKTKKTI